MNRDQIDSDELDEELPSPTGDGRPRGLSQWIPLLSALVTVATIGLYAWQSSRHEQQLKTLRAQAKSLQVRAPGSVQTYRIKPLDTLASTPTLQLGWPNPPQLLDLRLDVADSPFNTFQITVDKKNEARILQIRRIARDSNKEIRLSWNSSAFGPGEYQIRLEGYNLRGEVADAGWLSIGLE